MSRTKLAETLLSKVYGPYPDHIILKDDFPRSGAKLPIKEVQLHFNGDKQVIGFDDTEYLTTPPVGSRIQKNPDVVFFGVIEIEKLEDSLSPKGLEYLEADFKEELERLSFDHSRTGLTLAAAYQLRKQNSPLLTVRVCCRKTLAAGFLTSKIDPEKFLLPSPINKPNSRRMYWVKSLHPLTYASSLNFLDRYRLRRLIEELVSTDRDNTPLEERNINWIVKRYFETIRPRDRERRYIEELNTEEDFSSEPRHLRHVSRAEILGLFAAHSEWLLAHQIASMGGSQRMVDPQQWITFCKEARKDTITAKEHGIDWGLPAGQQPDWSRQSSLPQRMAKFGQTEQIWKDRLQAVQRRKSKRSRKQIPQDANPKNATLPPISFQYDSDFSEPSTPEATDSESDIESVASTIPSYIMEVPKVLNGHFKWNCPGCPYQIDLLNLSTEDIRALPPKLLGAFRNNSWRIHDEDIQKALCSLVSTHYQSHLSKNSIRVSRSGRSWHVASERSKRQRRPGTTTAAQIKQEDSTSDVSSLPLRRSSRRSRRPRRHDEDW